MGKVFAAGIAAIFVKGLSAKPWFSGTVAEVGENGVRSRSVFNDGGSGAVCNYPFDRLLTVNC